MILQSEHDHYGHSSIRAKDKVSLYFDAGKETKNYFENQLKQSQSRIRKKLKNHNLIVNGIEKLQQISERKVFTALQDSYVDYLQLLLDYRKQQLGKELPFMEEAILKKQKKIINDLNSESLNIETNVKSLDLIKKELEEQLEIIRTKNPETQISREDREAAKLKEQQKIQNYLEFRRKGYWKVPNEKNSSAVVFVKEMKQRREKQRERYHNSLKQSEVQIKTRQQAKINQVKQLHKQERERLHENYQRQKQQRQKSKEEAKKMEEHARHLIKKYAQKKPAHVAYLEKQNRQQAAQQHQREEILQSIKQSKRHQSLVELKQSLKQLEYYQAQHSRQIRKQKFKERERQEEIQQKLQRLYKSNFYAKVQEEEKKVLPDKRKSKQQQILKMLVYSQRAQSEHTPKIDESLRQELLHQIQQEAKRENKLQKVTAKGEVVLFTKEELNPKPIGLTYLRELKEMNKLIKRDKATSCSQPEGIKIKDKSLEKHQHYKINRTISNWKNILETEKISTPQKQMMLKNYFELIEEETVRAVQDKRKSSLAKSIDIQRRVDHYEVQKAKAQLALLKSLK